MAKLGPSKQIHQKLPHFGPNSAGNGGNPSIAVLRKNRAPQGGKPLLSRLTMGEKPHLYLVDGSAYIFRAYHRLPPLTDPEGTPVGAVYGYTTMLWKLADDLDKADGPTHLAVVLDKSSQSFRNEIYDQYKANRPDPPDDLVPQFPLIRDATRAFSLPLVEEPDVEADDMIATYARAAQEQGWNVTIVSSDKDLMQLVGEKDGARIDMLDTMKNARIYIEEVEDKFGVVPEKVGDVLALMGDSVDNIPGIFGVGPKTASKLIAEHGDLTAALDAAEGMKKSKLKERLIEHRADAELSRVLVTLKEDCDLPIALDDMKLDGVTQRRPLLPRRDCLQAVAALPVFLASCSVRLPAVALEPPPAAVEPPPSAVQDRQELALTVRNHSELSLRGDHLALEE